MDGLPRSVYIDGFVGQSQLSESGDSLPALNPYLYHRTLDSVIPLQKYEDLEVQAEVYNKIIESNRENLALKQDIFLFNKKENQEQEEGQERDSFSTQTKNQLEQNLDIIPINKIRNKPAISPIVAEATTDTTEKQELTDTISKYP